MDQEDQSGREPLDAFKGPEQAAEYAVPALISTIALIVLGILTLREGKFPWQEKQVAGQPALNAKNR